MAISTKSRALYLQPHADHQPVFAIFHPATTHPHGQGAVGDTAVLICPPFGWEEICSYRSRRDWAEHLAVLGYPTLRIDLPGCGDSGGEPNDPDLVDTWTDAVSLAATWLRQSCDCRHVTAIGIGLGGMLGARAIGMGAPIDGLVLWATSAEGRSLVRELRTFARMEAAKLRIHNATQDSLLQSGWSGAGGFVLSAETTRSLEDLDLATLTVPPNGPRRALLLDRDGIAIDARLAETLQGWGFDVSQAPGPGYGAMTDEPQEAKPPLEVFATVDRWLAGISRDPNASPSTEGHTISEPVDVADECGCAELTIADGNLTETPFTMQQSFGRLFGVLAQPDKARADGTCVVFLNAGAIRRVGPNRMWVEMARRWACRGVPSLRLDFEGLGDTDGDAERFKNPAQFHVPEMFDQVSACLDALEAKGVGDRFVLVGLCSGSYWSFHGALRDGRVCAAFMLNPRTLFWDPPRETVRYVRRALLQPSSWRKIARGEVRRSRLLAVARRAPGSLLHQAIASWRTRDAEVDQLDLAFDALRDAGKHLLFAFSEGEPFHEELERQGRLKRPERWPNIALQLLPGRDHALRPIESQRAAHSVLERALEQELAHVEDLADITPSERSHQGRGNNHKTLTSEARPAQ